MFVTTPSTRLHIHRSDQSLRQQSNRQGKAFVPIDSKQLFDLGLPTSSSPLPVYRHLVSIYNAGHVSFRHIITFNMDEYVALSEEHPELYHSIMHTNFFRHVDITATNINILDGNAVDLEAECERYEAKIRAVGGIDFILGGVGRDGHIAFNEPGSNLVSRTRVEIRTAIRCWPMRASFLEELVRPCPRKRWPSACRRYLTRKRSWSLRQLHRRLWL